MSKQGFWWGFYASGFYTFKWKDSCYFGIYLNLDFLVIKSLIIYELIVEFGFGEMGLGLSIDKNIEMMR